MAQQVVTELVIDSAGASAGADQFSQAMDRAGNSAKQGVGSVTGLTLAVAGVGVGFVGALAALRGFIDYVGNTNKELIDLATNAANAGMTTKSFQETLFAAKSSGLTDKDFISGLDKIGSDLTAASRGATDFGKLFEANNISIKDANGQLKTTEAALGDISNLIKNAPTPQIANAVASIVGLSKDWIPFLRQGVDGIEEQKKAAADLGVIIDDATIQKAKEFNNQWHAAIATWDLQFKASLTSILPLLVQMASLASKIIDGVGSVSSNVSRWMTPDEDKSKQQLAAQQDDVLRLIDLMTRAGDAAEGFQKLRINNLQGLLGLPEGSSMAQAVALLDKLNGLYDKEPTRLIVTPSGNGSTVLPPSGNSANDPVDRAINSLQKHIETQKADTLAVGLGDGALASFRATAAETAAVQANGGKETEAQAEKFATLRQAASDAADALAKAKVASSISVGQQTALLSAEDVAIASQLKGMYGDNIPAALDSTYASAIRVNTAFKGVGSAIDTNLTTGLTDIVSGTKSASQGFTDMSAAIVKAIEQMIIKIAVVEPLMRSLQMAAGGLGIPGLNFGGGGVGNYGQAANATGLGAGTGGLSFPMFADGTDSAPGGWSIVGEKGPEIVNLSPGAQVIPNGGKSANDNGARSPNIIINNHTEAQPQVSTNSNGDVTITLKKMVDGMVGDSISSGTGMRVLDSQYGVKQFAGR
ncbi:hypothetical protein SAMN05444159_1261 [Bradyrhizobium lablabi]|uniref:Uncharacterized protein n=1 Tax=Bradyrhizobium lablabi TaxID=722472 RepID=A0A1M6LFE3_9BRAD|nr:hypothetical protein [Bradyrhizobium lablabi]SHJ69922.1 hypothetical protein SAMN05444159_1261 [Bradyrhizobium lablabi]